MVTTGASLSLAEEPEGIDAKLAAIADRAEARRFLRLRRGVDWTAAPQDIAAACRRLLTAIRLDQNLRPVRAEWRVRPPLTDDQVAEAQR